ncbi:uncharacterized protein LOC141855862 [Brevipalpus obovatus]|uniref:uncharacterized protein LOC141855862 n=1 Tax=Brevipalpus obovatus TaxID=246614 RepID=UPI003D9F53E7
MASGMQNKLPEERSKLLQEQKGIVRSFVACYQHGATVSDIIKDYEGIGESIPFRRLGYPDVRTFLNSIRDTLRTGVNSRGEMVYLVASEDGISHIVELVKGQKSSSKKPKRRSPFSPRSPRVFPTRGRGRGRGGSRIFLPDNRTSIHAPRYLSSTPIQSPNRPVVRNIYNSVPQMPVTRTILNTGSNISQYRGTPTNLRVSPGMLLDSVRENIFRLLAENEEDGGLPLTAAFSESYRMRFGKELDLESQGFQNLYHALVSIPDICKISVDNKKKNFHVNLAENAKNRLHDQKKSKQNGISNGHGTTSPVNGFHNGSTPSMNGNITNGSSSYYSASSSSSLVGESSGANLSEDIAKLNLNSDQDESSSYQTDDDQEPNDTENVPPLVINAFKRIMDRHKDGITNEAFSDEYEKEMGSELDSCQYGFDLPMELFYNLPSIFRIFPGEYLQEKTGSDIPLMIKPEYLTDEHLKWFREHEQSKKIEWSLKERVMTLLMKSQRKMSSIKLSAEYYNLYSEGLNPKDYNFEDFLTLFGALAEVLPLKITRGPSIGDISLELDKDYAKVWTTECIKEGKHSSLKYVKEIPVDAMLPGEIIPVETIVCKEDQWLEILIPSVLNPNCFWVNLAENGVSEILEDLMREINDFRFFLENFPDFDVPEQLLLPDLYCLAVFSVDKKWQRCKIVEVYKDENKKVKKARVAFIDYGGEDKIDSSKIRMIKRCFGHPSAKAIRVSLKDIQPSNGSKWDVRTRKFISDFGKNSTLYCRFHEIVGGSEDGPTNYNVEIKAVNLQTSETRYLNEELINAGHGAHTRASTKSNGFPMESPSNPVKPIFKKPIKLALNGLKAGMYAERSKLRLSRPQSGEDILGGGNTDGESKWTCIDPGLIQRENSVKNSGLVDHQIKSFRTKHVPQSPSVLVNGNQNDHINTNVNIINDNNNVGDNITNMKLVLNGKDKFSSSFNSGLFVYDHVMGDNKVGLDSLSTFKMKQTQLQHQNSSQISKDKSSSLNGCVLNSPLHTKGGENMRNGSPGEDCVSSTTPVIPAATLKPIGNCKDSKNRLQTITISLIPLNKTKACGGENTNALKTNSSSPLTSSSQNDNNVLSCVRGISSCNSEEVTSNCYETLKRESSCNTITNLNNEMMKDKTVRASSKRRKVSSSSSVGKKGITAKRKAKSSSSTTSDRSTNPCDRKFQHLISHKFLLSNLIKVKQSELKHLVHTTKEHIKLEGLLEEPGRTHLDTILESRSNRISSKHPYNFLSIRRGTCCFENDDLKCNKPSLPFGRHCRQHILYNVDQLLFVRCTAKDSETLTQCTGPSLDILRGDPLCNHHWRIRNLKSANGDELGDMEDSSQVTGKGKGKNGSRPGRRSKKRRRIVGGKTGNNSIDSIDSSSFLSQDSSDGPFISTDNCDPTQVHLSTAIKTHINDIVSSSSTTRNEDQVISSSSSSHLPATHNSDLPSERTLFDSLSIVSVNSPSTLLPRDSTSLTSTISSRVIPHNQRKIVPTPIDVNVSSIVPGDEALVASLVAELPPLGQETVPEAGSAFVDADLNDVLNKMPDDAFTDLFVDNLKNGDIPSREESEALEQALATVSKTVHYLSVAAAEAGHPEANLGHRLPTINPVGPINGDTNFYSPSSLNGQNSEAHIRLSSNSSSLNLNENEILGLANNILTSLTTEQQQQLNGLIDGALASGTLASSPTLKSALASMSSVNSEGEQLSLEAHL